MQTYKEGTKNKIKAIIMKYKSIRKIKKTTTCIVCTYVSNAYMKHAENLKKKKKNDSFICVYACISKNIKYDGLCT